MRESSHLAGRQFHQQQRVEVLPDLRIDIASQRHPSTVGRNARRDVLHDSADPEHVARLAPLQYPHDGLGRFSIRRPEALRHEVQIVPGTPFQRQEPPRIRESARRFRFVEIEDGNRAGERARGVAGIRLSTDIHIADRLCDGHRIRRFRPGLRLLNQRDLSGIARPLHQSQHILAVLSGHSRQRTSRAGELANDPFVVLECHDQGAIRRTSTFSRRHRGRSPGHAPHALRRFFSRRHIAHDVTVVDPAQPRHGWRGFGIELFRSERL
jgi:hypothetical protein